MQYYPALVLVSLNCMCYANGSISPQWYCWSSNVDHKIDLGTPSKKRDLRTLSQKEGGGPDQIPKFVVCEIGT